MILTDFDEAPPAFAVGDVPSAPVEFTLETTEEWDGIESPDATVTLDGNAVSVTLGALDDVDPGILTIRLTAVKGSQRQSVEPLRLVVEDPATPWHTLASLRREWLEAPDDDLQLFELLMDAREACEAYLRDVGGALPDEVTPAHRKAQHLQAKAIWTAQSTTVQGAVGEGEYAPTVFPLDWHVRQLLRPRPAIPGMF